MFLAIVIFCAFVVLYLFWIEPRGLVIRRFQEPLPGLSVPLKVVVAADLQPNSLHWPVDRLGKAFSSLNKENPDLVLWLGDMIAGSADRQSWLGKWIPSLDDLLQKFRPSIDEVAGAMAQLKPKMGHAAVLGERDLEISEEEVVSELERHGITVVQGDISIFSDPDSDVQVQVLGYGSREEVVRGAAFLHERLNRYLPTIGLCHSPDSFARTRGGPSVILAGHTHGGQVRLPYFGAFVLPLENRRFDKGWFTEWGQRFFVTSGIGTAVLPIRFLCPPEIVVIEFVPEVQD